MTPIGGWSRSTLLHGLAEELATARFPARRGRIVRVTGTLLEAMFPGASLGEECEVDGVGLAETVGFREGAALLMPYGPLDGLVYRATVTARPGGRAVATAPVGDGLRGRVINGLGEPIDGKGPLDISARRPLTSAAPDAFGRRVIRTPFETGVRVIDGLLTLGRGQRVGLMAGSGVGKSTLLGMIARRSIADVNVIALIGERGREVREFLEDVLGEEGLARSVVVVVTSDCSPVLQVRGAFLAAAIADWYRDANREVLLLMDSVTRLAMAQRQIGLALGEPPTTKGYTPSVFGLLPRLLERAGPGPVGTGNITALYTVLIDGDDIHDPVGDAVRGIVDGHLVLSRRLASQGQFPAIDVLQSISRVMPVVVPKAHMDMANRARRMLSIYTENEELIRLGAYKPGTNPVIDQSIQRIDHLRRWAAQPTMEQSGIAEALAALKPVVG
jgi:flagellum-specific ATP synthase